MKRVILTVIIITFSIISKAQQKNDSLPVPVIVLLDTNSILPLPGIMMKNNKPVGYNDDKNIFLLADEFKSLKYTNDNQGVIKNFNSWWIYTNKNINLSQDFIGLAPDSKELSKKVFLQLLTTGNFYIINIGMTNNLPYYKLNSFSRPFNENRSNDDTNANDTLDIQNTIIQLASNELFYHNMVGKELPTYQFEDIDGNKYNNINTKGKIIVLKCWFIHCVNCVLEFPDLNKLVDNYKNRKDILFISLATDEKQDLITFLKTHKLNYEVVPKQQTFMTDSLNITSYPTHIVIGKDGKIVKTVSNYNDLVPALKKETLKE